MPVLPEVGSTIVLPGPMTPRRSASSIIERPMRALIEPPGVARSAFIHTSTCGRCAYRRLMRMWGVFPIVSRMLAAFTLPPSLDVEVERLVVADRRLDPRGGGDDRVRRDAPHQPDVAANAAAVADHGVTAEDRRVGVDHDIVADRRVALDARHAFLDAEGAERDALVELDARAEHRGLADDDAGAVVDRE